MFEWLFANYGRAMEMAKEKFDPVYELGRDAFSSEGRMIGGRNPRVLTPEGFGKWFYRVRSKGSAWVTISWYAKGVDREYNVRIGAVGTDIMFYDFDIEMDKKELVRMFREDRDRFDSMLAEVRDRALSFARAVGEKLSCTPLVHFSGFRGYHVDILLSEPIDPSLYKRVWYALLVVLGRADEVSIDDKVRDPSRLFRLPFTKHEASGMYSVPIDPETGEEMSMRAYSSYVSGLRPLDVRRMLGLVEPLIRLAESASRVAARRGGRRRARRRRLPKDPELALERGPPCMRGILESLRRGELDHYGRVVMVLFLKWLGFSEDDVVGLFRRYAKDFSEERTRYQVEYLYGERGKREDWRMYSCRSMESLGLCPSRCGLKNPLDYYLRRMRRKRR